MPPGGPIISDGDLLGENCTICAPNAELLQVFDIHFDLGLDAADILSIDNNLVAFSTELSSPDINQFTKGDLLTTDGLVIPNVALTYAYANIGYDLGLDALHFIGEEAAILQFIAAAHEVTPEDWLANPGILANLLTVAEIDLWYSTEMGWKPAGAPGFLDGDLLSAKTGAIVAANSGLLPTGVPAGIPSRGVDFGVDAATADRRGDTQYIHFSTEILFSNDLNFTDGDVLRYGNGVVLSNLDLIGCFEPHANMLGLDALFMSEFETPNYLPIIQNSLGGGN